jgi:hypothetical protein
MANQTKLAASKYTKEIQHAVQACEAIRRSTEDPQEISLADYFQEKNQISMEDIYEDMGINPTTDTVQNIVNLPDASLRWLIPEIFREALRLGLRKAPIYPSLISGEQSVKQTSVTMPAINMSDAAPKKVGVAQTITVGDVSFDQKTVKISKIGRGIKVPYEVIQYVALNLVSLFLQDFGVKLGMGIDTLAFQTLLNGDQTDGSDSAAVIGIATANTLTYRDLLKIWVRAARMGKSFSTMIAGESAAMDVLDLLTTTRVFGTQRANITLKTPIPQNSSLYVSGLIADHQVIILDTSNTLIKLNAQPLLVETDKIISNQTEETYASLTTGFATIFKDSRLVLDTTLAFGSAGFPTYMDPTSQESITF